MLEASSPVYSSRWLLSLAIVAGYWRDRDRDPGLTPEVAMMANFLLGILAMRSPAFAAELGVLMAIIRASRNRLHRMSRKLLSEQELHDLLLLAGAAFVVLPLLPDRTMDPWQSINPYRLGLLVVAVVSISSLGYVLLRTFRASAGLAMAGLLGGFVPSTATVAAMAGRARKTPAIAPAAAAAGLMSNVATIIQLAVVLGSISLPLLQRVTPAMIASGLVAATVALVSSWRAFASPIDTHKSVGKRPFEPLQALRFVAVLAGIMLMAAILRDTLGQDSTLWVLAPSGLADVHAAAASAGQSMEAGRMDLDLAEFGVLAALASNTLRKRAVALSKGGVAFAVRLIPGVVAMVGAFAGVFLLH